MGLEPTIYRTRGEHANHHATDAVYLHSMRCKVLTYTSSDFRDIDWSFVVSEMKYVWTDI